MKEHAKAIATLDENSLLAKHNVLRNHEIDLENVEIVDRSPTWRQRLFLEAWHSVRDKNSINEHIALPSVYKNIHSSHLHFLSLLKKATVVAETSETTRIFSQYKPFNSSLIKFFNMSGYTPYIFK